MDGGGWWPEARSGGHWPDSVIGCHAEGGIVRCLADATGKQREEKIRREGIRPLNQPLRGKPVDQMRFSVRVPPSRGHGGRCGLREAAYLAVVHSKGPKRRIPADSNFFFLSVVFFSYSGLFAEVLFIMSFWGLCQSMLSN